MVFRRRDSFLGSSEALCSADHDKICVSLQSAGVQKKKS